MFSREKQPAIKAGKSKVCKVGHQAGDPGGLAYSSSLNIVCWQNLFLLGEISLSSMPSTDWLILTHI
jgi:hypothetical protein